MKRLLIYITCWLTLLPVLSQLPEETVLRQIEAANPTLKVLRRQIEANKLANRTGIQLPDPEVEFNYLWGNPVASANRVDFSVSQSFDFPTVYTHKRKLAEMENDNQELVYRAERMKLLTQARKLLVDLTRVNAMLKLYSERVDQLRRLTAAVEKRFSVGDATVLERNKAQLKLAQLLVLYGQFQLEKASLQSELNGLNGDEVLDWQYDTLVLDELPSDFENWYVEAAENNPVLEHVRRRVGIDTHKVQLRKAEALPRFKTGYMSEQVGVEKFQGVSVGISIPLWEHKNKVKQAQFQVKAVEQEEQNIQKHFYNRLRNLYYQYGQLHTTVGQLRQSLAKYDASCLLTKALESGEISLYTYLQELDYSTEGKKQLIEVEHELGLLMSELKSVEL